MRKNIKVTVRSLKKGQKISGFTHDNMHRGFVAYVKEVSPVYVTVEKWRIGSGELKKIPAYARFFIELFDEEIKDKYDRAAGEIVQSIQNKLYRDEIGSKELCANVKHFFTLLGKMFFTLYGKEFFTYPGKQIFPS